MTDFTKGTLQVSSGGLALLDEEGYGVAIAPDFRPEEEALPMMTELARRWNTHPDLVAALDAVMRCLPNPEHMSDSFKTIHVRAQSTLAAARGEAVSA